MTILSNNFVMAQLQAASTATDTTGVTVGSAAPPFNNIPDPSTVHAGISYLILSDSLTAPTQFEIISYTGYTVSGSNFILTGVTRGVLGTTAQAWSVGAYVWQSPLAQLEENGLWSIDPNTGNIQFSGGDVGIGKAPTKPLDIAGDGNVDGNLTVGGGISASSSQVETSTVTGDQTVDGNQVVEGTFSSTGLATLLGGVVLGTASEKLDVYRYGTWTPQVMGSTGAGTATYTAQTGIFLAIGELLFLQFFVEVDTWTANPTGDLIITGYPAVGSMGGYAGSMEEFAGLDLFRTYENNIVGSPVSVVKQNMVNFIPVTISDATNQGIKLRISVHTNDQSQPSLQTQAVTSNRFANASDLIWDGTSGEKLLLSGSILFRANAEYTS